MEALLAFHGERASATIKFVSRPDPAVFTVTKRIHRRLHGQDRGPLPDSAEHEEFVVWATENSERLAGMVTPADIVRPEEAATLGEAAARHVADQFTVAQESADHDRLYPRTVLRRQGNLMAENKRSMQGGRT